MIFLRELDNYIQLREAWNQDVERYCVERLGMHPTTQQKQLCEAITPEGARVSVVSGQNTGKDAITACIILWFLECKSHPRVPCTAPTSKQLYTILWAELSKWMRKSVELSRQRGDHERFYIDHLFRLTNDMLVDISSPQDWFAVARTTAAHTPENLQGFHASDIEVNAAGDGIAAAGEANFMFVLDEAAGIPDAISAVVDGATASPGARELQIGNGNRTSGFFYDTHQRLGDVYTLLSWKSAESTLCDPGFRPRMVKKFGADSDVVAVRCDAKFPKADADSLIPLGIAEPALHREPPSRAGFPSSRENRAQMMLGIDCAWEGDDRTAFVLRQGVVIPHLMTKAKIEPMEAAGYAVQLIREWAVEIVFVDVIGIGAGVYSRLAELRRDGDLTCAVVAVNVAKSAPERQFDRDVQTQRLRDYLWFEVRRYFRDDQPVLIAEEELARDLIGEITQVRMRPPDSKGFSRVEEKDAYKGRLGHSPDLGDALCCTFAPVQTKPFRYEAVGSDGGSGSGNPPTSGRPITATTGFKAHKGVW